MSVPYAVRRAADATGLSVQEISRRLRYSTFVNVERRYMYFEVPKAGCTTMKWLLHSVEKLPPVDYFLGLNREARRDMFIHERRNIGIPSLEELDDATQEFVLTSPDFMRFTVVRNPYERIELAWKDKIKLCAPGFEEFCKSIKGKLPTGRDPSSQVSFREFVEALSQQNLATCDPHWRLQSEHTLRGAMNFSHVGRLDDFSTLVRAFLAHIGETEREPAPAMNVRERVSDYDEEIATKVHDLYRPDFEVFGYDREGWVRPRVTEGKPRTVAESVFVDEVLERNIVVGHLYQERDSLRLRIRDLELDATSMTAEMSAIQVAHESAMDEMARRIMNANTALAATRAAAEAAQSELRELQGSRAAKVAQLYYRWFSKPILGLPLRAARRVAGWIVQLARFS